MYKIPNGIIVISFDIWKTLLVGNKGFSRPRLALILNEFGQDHVNLNEAMVAYREVDAYFNTLSETTGVDYGMGERLAALFNKLGINQELSDRTLNVIQGKVGEQRRSPDFLPKLIEPDLKWTLTTLHERGYRLGTLSNTGMDSHVVMEPLLDYLGLRHLFYNRVFSSQDGRAKPNPGIFQRMADEHGATPDQVLHVGDNIVADYDGAVAAGMHAVLFDPSDAVSERSNRIKSIRDLIRVP